MHSYYAQVFTQCIKLADTHEGMRELMFDARLGEVAGTLAGVNGIRIWHDQALIKPPYANATLAAPRSLGGQTWRGRDHGAHIYGGAAGFAPKIATGRVLK